MKEHHRFREVASSPVARSGKQPRRQGMGNPQDAHLRLIGQVTRLLANLLGGVRSAELRFAERQRLKRLLSRLTGDIAAVQATLLRADRAMQSDDSIGT